MTLISIQGMQIDAEAVLDRLEREMCEESLEDFVKAAWHVIEPGQPLVWGEVMSFICVHLEQIVYSVVYGDTLPDGELYNRLLINVPPGLSKSLLTSVFMPAWAWTFAPHLRFLCASHSQALAIRDNLRMRRLVTSEWYQKHWGDKVRLTQDQAAKLKFENNHTGFREASAAGSITGSRADILILDDPHSVESAGSEQQRATTRDWFLEAVPTRLNNPATSAIIVIMQRLHEEDVSGIILDKQLGYDHIMLPMEYDPARSMPTRLGWQDWRTEEGELLFPERFPAEVVARDKAVMGPYAVAGQFQQTPTPRGGGIIQRDWWQLWEGQGVFPGCDYILASLDCAYTEKSENDYSACTVWGVFTDDGRAVAANIISPDGRYVQNGRTYVEGAPKLILMYAWQERLELHALVQKVAATCKKYKVDTLLVEAKASGHSLAQEIKRLFGHEDFAVRLYNPKAQDKVSRLYSIQHIFAEGMVYAPDMTWAEMVMTQCAQFPKGKHDDLVDSLSQGVRYLREMGLLVRAPERLSEIEEGRRYKGAPPAPLYPV